MSKQPEIYKLGLHEVSHCGAYEILRVPGGWIYSAIFEPALGGNISVFVPFDNEFQVSTPSEQEQ